MEVGSVVTEASAVVDSLLGVLVEGGVAESVGVGTVEVMSVTQAAGKRPDYMHNMKLSTLTFIIESKESDFSHINPVNWFSVKGHKNVKYVVRTWIW